MADYINRKLLLNDLETSIVVSGRTDVAPLELRGVHKVIDRIKAMPTEDVVPVVRCKDCKLLGGCHLTVAKRMKIDSKGNITFETNLNHYCSFGERKDECG